MFFYRDTRYPWLNIIFYRTDDGVADSDLKLWLQIAVLNVNCKIKFMLLMWKTAVLNFTMIPR